MHFDLNLWNFNSPRNSWSFFSKIFIYFVFFGYIKKAKKKNNKFLQGKISIISKGIKIS